MTEESPVLKRDSLVGSGGLVVQLATPIAIVAVPVVQAVATKYISRPSKEPKD